MKIMAELEVWFRVFTWKFLLLSAATSSQRCHGLSHNLDYVFNEPSLVIYYRHSMMGGWEPTTVYVRRKTDTPLRLWLFGALAGVCALITLTLVGNQEQSPSVKMLGESFGELHWHELGRPGNQQRLRFSFLDGAGNESAGIANGTAAAANPPQVDTASAPLEFIETPLSSSISDLSPDAAYLSARLGKAASSRVIF